ncbi:hypothetical protein D5086_007052 [Populus alba]|uniref:Uncharacterized protein n=1 Tax=Populus alba TaxID=43335 RepID=A0ACC4CME3_POPAL
MEESWHAFECFNSSFFLGIYNSEEVYEGLSSANLDSSRGAQDMALQKNYDNDGVIECWQYGLHTDTVATPEDPEDVVDRQLYSRLI